MDDDKAEENSVSENSDPLEEEVKSPDGSQSKIDGLECSELSDSCRREQVIRRLEKRLRELRTLIDECEEPCVKKRKLCKSRRRSPRRSSCPVKCPPKCKRDPPCAPMCPCKPKCPCARPRCHKPGPITKNAYLNFLRAYRKRCCNQGNPIKSSRSLARHWCALSPACKRRYCYKPKKVKPFISRIFSFFLQPRKSRSGCRRKRNRCRKKVICKRKC